MDKTSAIAVIGFLLALFGVLSSFCWNLIFNLLILTEFPLSPTSTTFREWTNPNTTTLFSVYFFNWTNPEQLFEDGFKPKLVEVGPYTFVEEFHKVETIWNKNGTLSYKRLKFVYFDQNNSVGSLDDNITTLNPIALTAAYKRREGSFLAQFSISNALRMTKQEVWITKPVEDLIFKGYSDPLLSLASKLSSIMSIGWAEDKFAWLYNKNGSTDFHGTFNIDTGAEDISRMGLLREWQNKNRTDMFRAHCGMINGSDGIFYPPGQTRDKPIEMYVFELCRSLKFEYSDDVDVQGIPGYRYMGSKLNYDNGDVDPNNWCNCDGECVPNGAINVSKCQHGAPIFASNPHYLHADPFYIQQVDGLQPNESKHSFSVTVEPNTGLSLEIVARIQINLLLQSSRYIAMYNDVPRIFFPTVWFEQKYKIPADNTFLLKLLLAIPNLGIYLSIGLVLLGLNLMAISLAKKYFIRIANRRTMQRRKLVMAPGHRLAHTGDRKASAEFSLLKQNENKL